MKSSPLKIRPVTDHEFKVLEELRRVADKANENSGPIAHRTNDEIAWRNAVVEVHGRLVVELSALRHAAALGLAALEAVEWSVHHAAENSMCEWCYYDWSKAGGDGWRDQKEHTPSCQRAAAIAALRGGKAEE